MHIDKFLFNCNFWPPRLGSGHPFSPFLLLFTDELLLVLSGLSFAGASGDDLELFKNCETSCSLINQVGTSGAVWSVNTCLNSSLTQICCLISLKNFFLFFFPQEDKRVDVFQPRRRIARAGQNSTDCPNRHQQRPCVRLLYLSLLL